ncbi:hypothetical protein GLYMA_10G291050v4 [Glycine max]|nr:hypothetical protein GLYMA_10G291050v4 [Glycine max]KAH1140622.1 hypothetical protein GYH30_029488 [Glycine max]
MVVRLVGRHLKRLAAILVLLHAVAQKTHMDA